jgi:hypothetical protein
VTFGFESADRYLGAPELVADYFGCFALNNCNRVTVRRLRSGYQVTGSGLKDIVFSPITFRVTNELRAIEQSFDAHGPPINCFGNGTAQYKRKARQSHEIAWLLHWGVSARSE